MAPEKKEKPETPKDGSTSLTEEPKLDSATDTKTADQPGAPRAIKDFADTAADKLIKEPDKKSEGTPETPETPETPDQADNPDTEPLPGKLQEIYQKELEKISEEQLKKDREKIKGSEIEEVRYNTRLLKQKEGEETDLQKVGNLKEETRRRIKAYTSGEYKNNWYTLDYASMGTDKKGLTHEYHVGLGDILLDQDIKDILVMKADGQIIKAHRGLVAGGKRYGGRVAFLDENDDYVATYTGERFRILTDSETNPNDTAQLSSYITTLSSENESREKHHAEFHKELEERTYFDDTQGSQYTTELAEDKSVAEQILKNLNPGQRANARIIEEEFNKALPKWLSKKAKNNIIAAAIINSFAESKLKADAIGKETRGVSVGLFQLYDYGAGHNMTIEARQDPRINTQKILKSEILAKGGKTLLRAAGSGASIPELAAIFSRDIERPRDTVGAMSRRSRLAYNFFGKKIEGVAQPDQELVAFKFITPEGLNGRISIKKNQEKWLLGSSTVYGMAGETGPNCGICGIIGANPDNFYTNFTQIIWPKLQNLPLPKKVILAGLAINGLSAKGNPTRSAKNVLQGYVKIAKFFEEKGVEVKICTVQPYKPKLAAIKIFNKLLKDQYANYCLDTASKVTTADGNDWLPGMTTEGLHLAAKGKKLLNEDIQKA